MKFEIGKIYLDRTNQTWECVRSTFGSLPTFKSESGKNVVQSAEGKYYFDGREHDRDMIAIGE